MTFVTIEIMNISKTTTRPKRIHLFLPVLSVVGFSISIFLVVQMLKECITISVF